MAGCRGYFSNFPSVRRRRGPTIDLVGNPCPRPVALMASFPTCLMPPPTIATFNGVSPGIRSPQARSQSVREAVLERKRGPA